MSYDGAIYAPLEEPEEDLKFFGPNGTHIRIIFSDKITIEAIENLIKLIETQRQILEGYSGNPK